MTEKELLEKIKESAENIEVPKSLSPEKILEKCRNTGQESMEEDKAVREGKRDFGKRFPMKKQTFAVLLSTAALLFVCGLSVLTAGRRSGSDMLEESTAAIAAPEELEESSAAGIAETAAEVSEEPEAERQVRQNAGELYTLAESYDIIYERLEEQRKLAESREVGYIDVPAAAEQSAGRDSGAPAEDGTAESAYAENRIVWDLRKEEAVKEKASYSKTNVQTYGIDESDIVKTDGSYIYVLRGSSVHIIKAGEELEAAGVIGTDTESGAAEACAMYVDGDKLIVITQENRTALEQQKQDKLSDEKRRIQAYAGEPYYMDSEIITSVMTYDIRDKKHPVLSGKVTQDGRYFTSRKDGDMLYLFTDEYLENDRTKDMADAIPKVNDVRIAEDCIYIGDSGTRALVISSVFLQEPEKVRDTVMLLDNDAEVYMGPDSLYLYRCNYKSGSEVTEIAKFSMADGYLNGVSAVSLKGRMEDVFAIHEKNNKLRVLTTDFSGRELENCLFLLDEKLNLTGKLERIAVGERIYAARYLGDMAYFITYRNMDPLFAADLSDEKAPLLLGELEITGFSEYLHFWGEDKLLGIGYETDPKTGAQKGMKLVMFDMSNPADLKILGTKVLKDVNYSPALYDYKAVLANSEENLIGFATESYRNGAEYRYELFQWTGEGFENILSENIKDGYSQVLYRGMYIGDKFYIAHPEIIRYYDRKDYSLKQTFKTED